MVGEARRSEQHLQRLRLMNRCRGAPGLRAGELRTGEVDARRRSRDRADRVIKEIATAGRSGFRTVALMGCCAALAASTERGGIHTKPAAPVRPSPRLLLGDFRGPGAVVEARLVVAAAWGTAAVSALPFSPCPSPALHGPCERERHEDRHGVGIVPDDFGEPGGWWDGFAVFGHAFDMHGERLSCSLKRLVEAARR